MRGQVDPHADVYLPRYVGEGLANAWLEATLLAIQEGRPIPRVEQEVVTLLAPTSDSVVYMRALGRAVIVEKTGARVI